MPQQPAVTLTDEDHMTLESFVHRAKANSRTLTRTRILLKSAVGWSISDLAAAFDVCEHWSLPSVGWEFVAAMEDVLDLYEHPYDQHHPTVCFDAKPAVLHTDVRPSLPGTPGQPERVDCEYERRGTANLFFLVEPLAGWRHVAVTAQRTMQDYAKVVCWLVDGVYPHAASIRLVQDNLNTHAPASLYETFAPA